MIGTLVTFRYDEETYERSRIAAIAEKAHPDFQGMPGLRSKVFTIDDEQRRAMNFYLWDDAGAATAFFSDQLLEYATGLYGVAPSADHVDIAAEVHNTREATPV
jgi:hypothetical protein